MGFLLTFAVFPQEAGSGAAAVDEAPAETPPGAAAESGPAGVFPPDSLRRPSRGESPRYPRDMIIGELGRGTAPEEAWLYARNFLNALIRENAEAPALAETDASLVARALEAVKAAEAGRFHLGGGREEADGSVSFLVRFLGGSLSMTGELYLVPEENGEGALLWRIDDLALEESRNIAEEREAYRYDFSPYERFY